MTEQKRDRPVHTEHMLFECWVTPDNTDGVLLFRAPTRLDGRGDHRRLPHQVAWLDVRQGDALCALRLLDLTDGAQIIDVLQFWHVLEVRDDEFRIEINNLVGAGGDGEFVYDRFAGMLGLPPGTRTDGS